MICVLEAGIWGHGWVITSYSMLFDIYSYLYMPRYLFLALPQVISILYEPVS